MAKRWLQSVDLEIDEQGRPVFESALAALAALIADGRLKVSLLAPIEADIVIADMQSITGAASDAKSLFDLWTLLGSPAQQPTLETMAMDITNIATSIGTPAQESSNGEIMANTGTIASAAVAIETSLPNVAQEATAQSIATATGQVAGAMNIAGGSNCINALIVGANGSFINETDYALNVAIQSSQTPLDVNIYEWPYAPLQTTVDTSTPLDVAVQSWPYEPLQTQVDTTTPLNVIDPGQEEYYDGFANLYDNGSTVAFALTIKARQMAMQVQVTATTYTAGTIALEGSLDNGYWAVLDSKELTETGTYLLQSNALARYVRLTVTNNNGTDVTYQPVFYAQR